MEEVSAAYTRLKAFAVSEVSDRSLSRSSLSLKAYFRRAEHDIPITDTASAGTFVKQSVFDQLTIGCRLVPT